VAGQVSLHKLLVQPSSFISYIRQHGISLCGHNMCGSDGFELHGMVSLVPEDYTHSQDGDESSRNQEPECGTLPGHELGVIESFARDPQFT
jgi:hypothetical protein